MFEPTFLLNNCSTGCRKEEKGIKGNTLNPFQSSWNRFFLPFLMQFVGNACRLSILCFKIVADFLYSYFKSKFRMYLID